MWHYTDAYTLQDCAATYDAIFHSGAIDDKNKAFIEKQLFAPVQVSHCGKTDQASNDIPSAMPARLCRPHFAGSRCHRLVIDPEEGFEAFFSISFQRRDLVERAASNHLMAVRRCRKSVRSCRDIPTRRLSEHRPLRNLDLRGCKSSRNFSAMWTCACRTALAVVKRFTDRHPPDPTPLEALYNWTVDRRWCKKQIKPLRANWPNPERCIPFSTAIRESMTNFAVWHHIRVYQTAAPISQVWDCSCCAAEPDQNSWFLPCIIPNTPRRTPITRR